MTIYDAEDRPEPLQLRRAVDAFRRAGPRTVCLQARLQYYNARQNMLTRWFTVDYTTWFAIFLPGLASFGLPVPLGGTSNHIRAESLVAVGGWDPYNVTEDADLGIRLVRSGLRTGIIDSVTYEEANSDGLNWVRQRSRWYKGYMQTWLVHARQPVRMLRELGPHGFVSVTLLTGATPLLSGVNLLSWTCTIIFIIGTPSSLAQVFPAPVVYFGTAAAFFGNATVVYVSLIACRQTHQGHLAWAALTYPLYWVLMAVAAVKSLWQLVARPSYWEKTVHGLARGTRLARGRHRPRRAPAAAAAPPRSPSAGSGACRGGRPCSPGPTSSSGSSPPRGAPSPATRSRGWSTRTSSSPGPTRTSPPSASCGDRCPR